MWPDHCVQGSKGCEYYKDFMIKESDLEVLKGKVKMVESYSGFGGDGEDTKLAQTLKDMGVSSVYCCGLAYDYCVGSTAESAAKEGFDTFLVRDATRSVAKETETLMEVRMKEAGVKEIASETLL
uniref:nicotinamidase n=1 Tax=Strombidium rassoulzadegani TaxID=1082188 RepID=A0A7S3CIC3_9SPIT|mmetsp:Transcript_10934/g.18279  ORF Transcript_10934/g.18279 Transcript_10934/m.18279 type:complete len:125 (+) Transcript_10934:263-637(+)|eukprot:CAMPEP_0168613618 /NCGR_PEP_ID=MMETSP0449_2-20121227/3544_1 /TAXON_ID=1082188 /ORGANISM="Strombidium rassoulzadegani, Strain ras09" /LENGTH=124 /DNA_ID=CAMNT_0008654257 /DNA_START=246 /DNA_END=620 /DNA_ORIENTATION=+